MGIFDSIGAKVKEKMPHEFIDIIEWLDESNDTMIHRFERYQNEIKYGAQLIVRESQVAVLVDQGQIADVFTPGRYKLETANIPVLSTLKGWKYGFNSPFKAEVYFASTRNFTDKKWGTKNPVMLRDPEFGPIRLRAFGNYALRVNDAAKFIREIAGTDSRFSTEEITEQLKNIIITRFSDILGESKIPAIDMASQYNEISELVHNKIQSEFMEYGLELTKFLLENVSFPPEVEEALDKRTSMGVIGNMDKYMKFQSANAMEDAAKNPGGSAGEGIGMGMGFAMASQMAQGVMNPKPAAGNTTPPAQQSASGPGDVPPPIPGAVKMFVAVNGKQTGPYDMGALENMIKQGGLTKESLVWKKGMAQWTKAGSVQELGAFFEMVPPPIPGA